MKTNVIFWLLVLVIQGSSATAQVNEIFFESLKSHEQNLNADIPYYGFAETSDGIATVCIDDSLNNEVHFALMDSLGKARFFHVDLPADSLSDMEAVSAFHVEGIDQYLITQNFSPGAEGGIRLYHFQQFTQYKGELFIPMTLMHTKLVMKQVADRVLLFVVSLNREIICIQIKKNDLSETKRIILGSFNAPIGQPNFFKSRMACRIVDSLNIDLFCANGSKLERLRMVQGVVQVQESLELGVRNFLGINEIADRIVFIRNVPNISLCRAKLDFNASMNDLQITDSTIIFTSVSTTDINLISRAIYTGDLTHDFLISNLKYMQLSHGVIDAKSDLLKWRVPDFAAYRGGKLLLGGLCDLMQENYASENHLNLLYMSYTKAEHCQEFEAYQAEAKFGSLKLQHNFGNVLMNIDQKLKNDAFRFEKMIYSLNIQLAGSINNEVLGTNRNETGNLSFRPGPYTQDANYDFETEHAYHKNYYIDRQLVETHKQAIQSGQSAYIIPDEISKWPANGHLAKGQALTIAPFFDQNQDGIYTPEDGDYPLFPGDFCLVNISHQTRSHAQGKGLGIELHSYAYGFDCDEGLENTVFYRQDVINRENIDIDTFLLGVLVDGDLGNYNDDYVGTHVDLGLIYTFNGDNFDEQSSSTVGWGDSIPAFGIQFLKGNKMPANNIDDLAGNDIPLNGYGIGDMLIDNEYFGLEYSLYDAASSAAVGWVNSQQGIYNWLSGRNGYGQKQQFFTSNMDARYMFPGTSDLMNYGTHGINPGFIWGEPEMFNQPGDRRMIGSFGGAKLAAGEKRSFDFALTHTRPVPGNFAARAMLFDQASKVKHVFHANQTTCGQVMDPLGMGEFVAGNGVSMKTFPNPSSGTINIELNEERIKIKKLLLFDLKAQLITTIDSVEASSMQVDLSNQNSGVYLVQVHLTDGYILQTRIVKM